MEPVSIADLHLAWLALVELRSILVQEKFDVDTIQSVTKTVELVEKFRDWKSIESIEETPDDCYERAMGVIGR